FLTVERFLDDRITYIDPNRPKRRNHGDADAHRDPDRGDIRDRRALDAKIPVAAEIGEYSAVHRKVLRRAERQAQLHRSGIVLATAQRILGADVARSDAAITEPAQEIAAEEEAIADADVSSDAFDDPGLAGHRRDDTAADRKILATLDHRPHKAGVAAETGEI